MHSAPAFAVLAATMASLVGAAPIVPEDAIYQSLVRRGGRDTSKLTEAQKKAHETCGPAVGQWRIVSGDCDDADLRSMYVDCHQVKENLSVEYPTLAVIDGQCHFWEDRQTAHRKCDAAVTNWTEVNEDCDGPEMRSKYMECHVIKDHLSEDYPKLATIDGKCHFSTPERKTRSADEPTSSGQPQPQAPEEKEASPSEKEASPSEKEASPSEKEASPSEKEASPSEKEASPSKKEPSGSGKKSADCLTTSTVPTAAQATKTAGPIPADSSVPFAAPEADLRPSDPSGPRLSRVGREAVSGDSAASGALPIDSHGEADSC